MSAIPSLSVWSSVKILLPRKNKKETKSYAPYVDSWNQINQAHKSSKTPREVVSLRVPRPLARGKENSHVSQDVPKKRALRRRPRKISHVTVPDIQTFESGESSTHCIHKRPSREGSHSDEFNRSVNFDENIPDSDDELEFDCMPSVKPWTPEELRMLNNRYNLMEEKAVEKTKNKRRVKIMKREQRTPRTPNRISCSDAYNSQMSLFRNFSYDKGGSSPRGSFPTHRVGKTEKDYYERKLAELYVIELGMKL